MEHVVGCYPSPRGGWVDDGEEAVWRNVETVPQWLKEWNQFCEGWQGVSAALLQAAFQLFGSSHAVGFMDWLSIDCL